MKDGEVVKFLQYPYNNLVGKRMKANIVDNKDEEIPLLFTLSSMKEVDKYTCTVLTHNISAELF